MLSFALNLQPCVWQFTASALRTAKPRLAVHLKKPLTQSIRCALQARHTSSIHAQTASTTKRHMWTDEEVSQLVEYIDSNFVSKGQRIRWGMVSDHLGLSPRVCHGRYEKWKQSKVKDKTDPSKVVRTKAGHLTKRRTSSLSKVSTPLRKWTPEEISRLFAARGDPTKKCLSWDKVAEYVGNGRTGTQCYGSWKHIRDREQLLSLQEPGIDLASCDEKARIGIRMAQIKDNWTRDETARLTELIQQSSEQHFKFILYDACKLFPEKPPVQLRRKMKRIKEAIIYKERRTRLLEKLSELRQMVKDYGGIEKTDWKAISKVAGLTEHECKNVFRWMFAPTRAKPRWTHDETDRLVQSLRRQGQNRRGSYNWGEAAIDVGSRTGLQCANKFKHDTVVKKTVEQPLFDMLLNASEQQVGCF